MLDNILQTIVDSFDLGYMVSVNILTYILIKLHDEVNGDKNVPRWNKRLYLIFSVISIGACLYYFEPNIVVTKLVYSAIAAPVIWSWALKPLCKYAGVDYKKIDKVL